MNKNDVNIESSFKAGSSMKALNNISQRPPVNIQFNDIGYTVTSYRRGERKILHNVSGEFRSGELSCILGPSGAGKSTLLNILTGYFNNGFNGSIKVNGNTRDLNTFRKLSCYIMHDDLLQPRLTTFESMQIAADLKLGTERSKEEKKLIITEILQTLRLWKQRHTMCERLSGGEAKRLAVALELVNNPPVIFLDEPTSGLDVVAVRQLIILLQLLSRQSRTIICTIHQPSASMFELFDNAYVICEGRCCYQGSSSLLVPFLAEANYLCPSSHNPADFVIETLAEDHEAVEKTSALCQNGKLFRRNNSTTPFTDKQRLDGTVKNKHTDDVKRKELKFSASFLTQFCILITRMCIQSKRNKIVWIIQLVQYLGCSFFIGGIFFMIGNEGSVAFFNFNFYLVVIVFLSYTYTFRPILLLPMEIRIIRREYFNRWYGLKAYYAALTCSTIPPAIIFGMMFIIITYVMTGQLLEWDRFILFAIIGLLTGFCSEGLGIAIGSIFNSSNGAIIGPAIVLPLFVLCCYGIGFGNHIEPRMKILMSLSYLRYGFTGLSLPLFQNRTKMHCSEDICLYGEPTRILREMGMANDTYYMQVIGLLIFTVLFRTIAYFSLRQRLSNAYSSKIISALRKCLKN
ncbi:ATP-binding cassette sub-family G member 1-like isoform X2 [Battus philenor]|uniref:ATP-binding cassette sub-family G member 1-like isoform X2 n=1 Tax=Battus philenor TaxID=42288 RepID=UPI0035CF4E86